MNRSTKKRIVSVTVSSVQNLVNVELNRFQCFYSHTKTIIWFVLSSADARLDAGDFVEFPCATDV